MILTKNLTTVNMIDTGEAIKVLVTLPGTKKEAIQVSLKDEFINVKVEADKVSKEDAGEAPHYLWREFKCFKRCRLFWRSAIRFAERQPGNSLLRLWHFKAGCEWIDPKTC